MRKKIKWLWQYYREYPWVLFVLLVGTPIQSIIQVFIPRMVEFTMDYLETQELPENIIAQRMHLLGQAVNLTPIETFACGFVALGFLSFFGYTIVQGHRAWMNHRLEWHFRQKSFDNVTHKGPDFFNRFRTGDLITRMTDDVAEKLSWFACSGIFRFYEAVLHIGFIVAMMITIDPWLTLWTVGPLPLLIFIYFLSSSLLDKRYDHLQRRISKFNDIIEACFSGIRVVKSYVREDSQKAKFHAAAVERRDAEVSAVKVMTIIDSLYMYIWQFGIVVVLLVGGYMVIQAELTYGKLAAFIYYIVWLVFPMFDIGQFLVKSRQSAVSIDRLVELEEVEPMVNDSAHDGPMPEIRGSLTFDSVDFAFAGSEREILKNVSFDIQAGETVAVVGRVGAGKSWLVNLVPRLVDPTGGTITLDGRDLRRFRLEDLRRNIGFVPQEPALFSDTIRNNIVFGREGISDERVEWALATAQLKDEVAQFPKGIDTQIGTRGVSISGGQKQRLALARALVARPRILVLDDCTSALDSKTETALWDQLHRVIPDITTIMITHRPDTLEKADKIIVLDRGSVVQQGTHRELINRDGHYARIYRRYRLEQQVTEGT